MRGKVAIFFIVTTVICGFGWFTNYLSAKALVRYMKMKEYEPPTAEETKECVRWAAKEMFKK